MKIHDLKPAPGSHQAKRRVGRGIGGKGGKTAGRGTKGQGARGTVPPGFEGGQMPLQRRVPEAEGLQQPVPRRVPGRQPRHPRGRRRRLPRSTRRPSTRTGSSHKGALVKVLGRGELTRPLTVQGPRLLEGRRSGHRGGGRYR